MRSPSDDLTARARIRDAAITIFGTVGFAGASLRDVARTAGVSPALIVHHFGTKDGLREACDAFVVGSFMDDKDDLSGVATAAMMRAVLAETDDRAPLIDYVARMLVDDSAASEQLFDALFSATKAMLEEQVEAGLVRRIEDPDAMAVYVTMYGLAPIIMRKQLARVMGESDLTKALLERSTIPVMELFTHGIYADDRLLVAAREAVGRPHGPRSDKGENDPNQDPDPPR